MACIFCDRSSLTRAHVFRKAWLERLMPLGAKWRHTHERLGEEGFKTWWEKSEPDLVVKSVCGTCNEGWMNDLDHQAERLVEPMALGITTRLGSLADQHLVATWLTLVMTLASETQAEPILRPDQRKALREQPAPFDGATFWLTRTVSSHFEAAVYPRSLRLHEANADAYLCTVRVIDFVAQAFVPVTDPMPGLNIDRRANVRFLRQLWPSQLGPVVWPPLLYLPEDQIIEFADAFINA
jgi:hypothetical protein